MENGDYRKAIETLEPVIGSRPRDPEAYIMLAMCRLNVEDRQGAIQVCERALQICPPSVRLDEFYVSILRATTTARERKTKLSARLQQKPKSAAYMVGLSEALLAENPLDHNIERLVSKAASLLPDDPEAHYLYGRWACLNDRQELAVRELNRALSLTAANDRAKMQIHSYLGVAYDHLEKFAKADLAFREAMAFNQKLERPDPETLMEYVSFLHVQQREAEAQEVVMRILQFAKSYGPAHLARANFLAQEQKTEEALAEGELALKYAGTDKGGQRAAHAFLAKTCAALGRMDQAQLHQEWIESH